MCIRDSAGAHAEEDRRHVELLHSLEHALGRGQRETFVLVAGEGPGPRVEELQGAGAAGHLGAQEGHGDRDLSLIHI